MKMEKKIFLDKGDDLNKAVDSLISSPAEKIILNIPKGSVLGLSIHNFEVLERESETAGKELAIESVDEHILELASIATIPAVNPVFRTREKAVADIVPTLARVDMVEGESIEEKKLIKKTRVKAKTEKVPKAPKEEKPKRGKGGNKKTEEPPVPPEMMEDIVPKHERHEFKNEEPEKVVEYVPNLGGKRKLERERSKHSRKFWIITFSTSVVVLGLGYFMIADILPKVTINISIEKTSISFSNPVIVSTGINTASVSSNVVSLPGQLSVAKSNLSMDFPATGSSTMSAKAGGTMTIHNDYTQNQTLVATTRFESPDGKIFRLVKQISVAKGKSADAQVVADQAGSDYNVPPTSHWNIPGFKGKPQYDKIYGESKISMAGGAVGNQVIPTADDISQAKIKIESALLNVLKSKTLILNSQNLRLLDNASAFSVTTENIISQVDKNNNFSIFVAGELRQLVFDENMLKDIIVKSVATSTATSTADMKIDNFPDLPKSYGTSTADLANGKMNFSISGILVYEPKIDFDAFKNSILGLNADTLKTTIFALPGLDKANISFWPFWVNSVPKSASHVNMVVE